ncbi:MAG TPA: DUF89 family protein [Candidatus Avoscillospira avicola]|uniref:DUF89 family protein n=1 Tax=Candidatus Avoscillospira avicola TaxID=2840706 RepID=A0A9D1AQD3_9FIRM|nr:DUF89 family protein [Candidatus Avoscillospira avicola]
MQFDACCIECLVRRQFELARRHGDGEKADAYLRDVLRIILEAPRGVAAPWLTGAFARAYARYWPGDDAYAQLKRDSNDLVLGLLPQVREQVAAAEDPLAMALQFSRTGNFLDFGILTPETAHAALEAALAETPAMTLDPVHYGRLLEDLAAAKSLLILGDNAGEIAFDTVLVEALLRRFPGLSIAYCVRGENTLNDATREDAAYVGMDRLVPILDNGSAISGTELGYLSDALQDAMDHADVILSKGSGNFECLAGCGYNIYYVFMCKCRRLSQILSVPNMTGQFLRERELPPLHFLQT